MHMLRTGFRKIPVFFALNIVFTNYSNSKFLYLIDAICNIESLLITKYLPKSRI